MLWEQRIRYAALTDIGFRRQNNQDSYAVALCNTQEKWEASGHLFVVADGMGGHAVGELASKIATDTVPHMFDKLSDRPQTEAIRLAVEAANLAINERGSQNKDFLRMGTTCSTLVLCSKGAVIAHVGDSRVYRIRNRQIDQLTFDHSLVWEMIQNRRVHPKEAERLCPRNVITRSLGPEPEVNVDIEGPLPVMPGDMFLLCSDGLSGLLNDSEIGMIAGALPPDEACRLLVNLANLRGGPDNISVIIAQAGDLPKGVDLVYERPPVKPSPVEGLNWIEFSVMCLLAFTFLVGLCFFLLDSNHRLQGGAIFFLSALIGIGIWMFHRSRTAPPKHIEHNDPNSTVAWRPYRTAPAVITDEFIQQLTRMEAELQRAAIDDHWPVSWPEYEEVYRKTREAVEQRLFGRALIEYGHLFDLLMTAIYHQRKMQKRESKPKKGSSPAVSAINDADAQTVPKRKSDPEVKPPKH